MPYSTKLYQRLSTLSLNELKRFQEFLDSPFFNCQLPVRKLFALLTDFHPVYEVDEKWIFRELFPGEPYKDSRLRSLRTKLLKLLHQFLVQMQLEGSPVVQEELLVEAFREKGLFEAAQQEVDKALATLEPETIANFEDARRWSFMERARLDLRYKMGERPSALEAGDLFLSLDHYHLARRFELLVGIEVYGKVWDQETVFTGEMEARIMAERSGLTGHPLIAIYHQLLTSLRHNVDSQVLRKLREMIELHHARMSKEELLNIHNALVGKFVRELRRGVPGSLRNAFSIYQDMHRYQLIFGAGGVTIHLVRNIVAAGARLKEFKWTSRFLEEALPHLDANRRDGTYHFGSAQLAYHRGDYGEAKRHLLQVEFTDPKVRLSAQNLLLKCYFETRETEAFFLRETVRRYLHRRAEFPGDFRQGYLNFLNLVAQLYDLRWKLGAKKNATQLRSRLDRYDSFFNREWVLEQLGLLT